MSVVCCIIIVFKLVHVRIIASTSGLVVTACVLCGDRADCCM